MWIDAYVSLPWGRSGCTQRYALLRNPRALRGLASLGAISRGLRGRLLG